MSLFLFNGSLLLFQLCPGGESARGSAPPLCPRDRPSTWSTPSARVLGPWPTVTVRDTPPPPPPPHPLSPLCTPLKSTLVNGGASKDNQQGALKTCCERSGEGRAQIPCRSPEDFF